MSTNQLKVITPTNLGKGIVYNPASKQYEVESQSPQDNELRDVLVGIPLPFPLVDIPAGYLAMNGQQFDKTQYPKLALKYPSGQLPDLRGEFIRGWDNERGVDTGRDLLSTQIGSPAVQEANKIGHVISMYGNNLTNIGFDKSATSEPSVSIRANNNLSNIVNRNENTGASGNLGADIQFIGRTRPRNIAFQYICLAG